MEYIRATSLWSFNCCPLKYKLDIHKKWDFIALDIWNIVHLSRQSPTLARGRLKKLVKTGRMDATEKVQTEKMIDVMEKFNKTIPDKYEISYEVDLKHKDTLNNWQIEFCFTWHPDEVWINKETKQIEYIVDTKTAKNLSMWKDYSMLNVSKQFIYYPYLLAKQWEASEKMTFTYRVIHKSYTNSKDFLNINIEINTNEAIRETEKHIVAFFEAKLNNNYPPKKWNHCYFCSHKKECPIYNKILNLE